MTPAQAGAERALSLSYYTVPELSPLETIDVAADAGCQHVGLRLLNGAPGDLPTPLMADAALRRALLQRMRERNITALDASAARLRPDTRVAHFAGCLEVAAELGVRHLLASCDDPEPERLIGNMRELCGMARKLNLRIEIEFVPWMSIASLDDAAALLIATGCGNLGIAVDALHFDRSHGSFERLANLPADWLRYAHLCDAPRCIDFSRDDQTRIATRERLFPGMGEIDLITLLRALPDGIPLALEIPTATLALTVPARKRVLRAVTASRSLLAKLA